MAAQNEIHHRICRGYGSRYKILSRCCGPSVKFESPGWSEFATGETSFALHPASEKNRAGTYDVGFTVKDLQEFYEQMQAKGVKFPMPPTKQDFGGSLAQFLDTEGAHPSAGTE